MEEDYREDWHIDPKWMWIKNDLQYRKLKGFLHIWTYFEKIDGKYVCSKYTKEKGIRIASITNTTQGWLVHLFIGCSNTKSYWRNFNFLKDAEEECNMFLNDKLILPY